ncbi:hypothetical protein BDQ12DRAFT_658665 [Crucibulum laeve]|uniref:Uncharacterized protein n=1 Tax=Crucibulum laeve TaxID=68775 RepID=A0A5C3LLT3_9AGAR|nr:hypothetical protein BDQ12DRAFT_658665 [Crucibulum laeve]
MSGPLNIGYLLNWGLFGVVSVQVYMYYLAFPNDKPFIKRLVYDIFCMETIQSIVIARDTFVTFASGFGDPNAIADVHLLWLTISLIVIVACIVQLFYAFRIHVLSKKKVLPLIIVTVSTLASLDDIMRCSRDNIAYPQLALTQCGAGLSAAVIIHNIGNLTKRENTTLFIAQGVSKICSVYKIHY